LGKFLVRHEELLSDEFFVSASRQLAQKLGLKEGEAAADGTVIQAASSLRSLAKKEALEAEAAAAREAANAAAAAEAAPAPAAPSETVQAPAPAQTVQAPAPAETMQAPAPAEAAQAPAAPTEAAQAPAAPAEATQAVSPSPTPPPSALEKKAQRLEQAVVIATQRAEARAARGATAPQVSRLEPEAVNQPCKDGRYALAYKPSILVHSGRFILGQALDASSEVGVLEDLLQDSEQVGVKWHTLLLDTGYFQFQVLQLSVERGLDVLCPPERQPRNAQGVPVTHKGLFAKAAFHYDQAQDVYRCPAGNTLHPGAWEVEKDTQLPLRHYSTKDCKSCPLRAQCTSSASAPRRIGRYEGQELKETMAKVFEHPQARARYARRAPTVEPVFAHLKERQGLKRFHRRGLRGARLEFSLHCLAFNLQRAALEVCVLAVRCLRSGDVLVLCRASLRFF
jgi:hypothetical protein